MPLTPEGLTLLKAWEGCRLSAYPDPASGGAPWTIGYGHTGAEVVPGLMISREQADAWLEQDAAEASGAVDRLLRGVAPTPRQRDALISFCFNVGAGALERSTLRKRLLAGEAPAVVIAEELPRWCKGPNGPVEGLKRRRSSEVAHAQAGSAASQAGGPAPTRTAQFTPPIQRSTPCIITKACRTRRMPGNGSSAASQMSNWLPSQRRSAVHPRPREVSARGTWKPPMAV
ncbi:MAG: lysozyme [Cyanobacteria bacterium M_surface_10_m2_179]|nr:lysozyme [Cyanobacteria bacterium M_surface_10_m2_179]